MEPILYVYLAFIIVILTCELYLFYNVFGYFKVKKLHKLKNEMGQNSEK